MDTFSVPESQLILVNINGSSLSLTKEQYVDFMHSLSEWYD